MRNAVLDALTEEFVDRMREWAMKSSGLSTLSSSWPSDGPLNDAAAHNPTKTPRMLGRAHDTEMGISSLPKPCELAVRQFWLFEGQSLRWHAEKRGISRYKFESLVTKAHELLKAEFALQSERWRAQHRDRLAKLPNSRLGDLEPGRPKAPRSEDD